jgi:hypothetical protein
MNHIENNEKNDFMETQFLFDQFQKGCYQDVQLRELVGKLIKGMQPAAVRQSSLIVNDISPSIYVTTDENLLATVINNLLAVIVSRNHSSCIQVSAKPFSNTVLMHIKDQNKHLKETSINDLDELQPLAAKVGGCITICNQGKRTSTFAMSIADRAAVA